MGRWSFSTLQANHAMQGDYNAGIAVPGIGLSIYTGVGGTVEIVTKGGETIVYTAVPQGIFMQVPLFKEIGANTVSTDLTIAYLAPPYA